MKNIKLAKKLVKIAKSLIAEQNIANQEGKYTDFTGTIDWHGTKAQVENATFYLFCNGSITWQNGTWKKGEFRLGQWMNGTWQNGTFKGGTWDKGIWKNGTWYWGHDKYYNVKSDSPDKWDE